MAAPISPAASPATATATSGRPADDSSNRVRLTRDLLRRLPKAELHCHLDGAVRISTIIAMAREQGVVLPTMDEAELRRLVCVSLDCPSLEDYLRGFGITLLVLQRAAAITRAMYEVCEDAVADGVRYLEVRFSPILHTAQGLSLSAVMEAICEGQAMAEFHLQLCVRIIVCGMRQLPSAVTEQLAEIAWRYRYKGVAGFDLAGPEHGFSSKVHRSAFDLVQRKCINCTLHSGEGDGWESIRDSIQACGARRIGHGVRLAQNDEFMRYVADRGIVLECCITSNIQTKAVASLAAHPLRRFFDAGITVVPCTDNPTVSNVTLSGEYALIQETFDFSVEEMVRMLDHGFRSAFIPTTQRHRMRADALRSTMRLLHAEGYDLSEILASPYYEVVGADLSLLAAARSLPDVTGPAAVSPYAANPDLTLDAIRRLPKTDLHCKLDGSVSLPLLWRELQDAGIDMAARFGVQCHSEADLRAIVQPAAPYSPEAERLPKRIFKSVLQSPQQIRRALADVAKSAIADGVRYMEMAFRPMSHTLGDMTAEQALLALLDAITEETAALPIKINVVVYASTHTDDAVTFQRAAELAVKYRDGGVVGFGVYGDSDLPTGHYRYFRTTFDFLRASLFHVAIFAGKNDVGTIVAAINDGGAGRISGAFKLHQFPRLQNLMSTYGVPVELSLTDKLRAHTRDMQTFANPVGLLLDAMVPVTICSFRSTMAPRSRSEVLLEIVQENRMPASQLLALLGNGFRFNFQPRRARDAMFRDFNRDAAAVLRGLGFTNLNRPSYFAPSR